MTDPVINKTKVVVRKKRRVVVPNAESPPVEKSEEATKREPLKLKTKRPAKPQANLSIQIKRKLSIKPKAKPVEKKPKRKKKKKEKVELPPPPKCGTNKALRTLRKRFPNAFNDELKPLKPAIANDVYDLVSDVMSQQKLRHAVRAYQRKPQYMLNEATAGVVILDKEGNTVGEISPELAQQRMDRIKARAERGRMNEQKVLELVNHHDQETS